MESHLPVETISGQENPLQKRGIVMSIIESNELPLYEQAAQKTGFGILVDAREGEQHAFWYDGREIGTIPHVPTGMRTVTVGKGQLGIQITRPEGQKNHQVFWDEFKRIRVERDQKKRLPQGF